MHHTITPFLNFAGSTLLRSVNGVRSDESAAAANCISMMLTLDSDIWVSLCDRGRYPNIDNAFAAHPEAWEFRAFGLSQREYRFSGPAWNVDILATPKAKEMIQRILKQPLKYHEHFTWFEKRVLREAVQKRMIDRKGTRLSGKSQTWFTRPCNRRCLDSAPLPELLLESSS